jgi:hypothetical protein
MVWGEPETEADAIEIDALRAEYAVEAWAERYDIDTAEYSIVGGEPKAVSVRRKDNGRLEVFRVEGEAVPQYHAFRTAIEDANT